MDILQFIMGFIMGIYLMEILIGHLAVKMLLTADHEIDSSIQKGEKASSKTILMITQINGVMTVWIISFNESAVGRG